LSNLTAIRLSDDIEVRLKEKVELLNTTKSDYIRLALEEKLERDSMIDFSERNRKLLEVIDSLPTPPNSARSVTDEDIEKMKRKYMTEKYLL